MSVFERILAARGLDAESMAVFLSPDYDLLHDPFLLPDINNAVDRLIEARQKQDNVVIYGDYDIDGLTATTLLVDAFKSFGFKNVKTYMPNRFIEGYGLNIEAIEKISSEGVNLIVTVDCGSRSEKEIIRAGELGVDVIVTDHHEAMEIQPPALAVVNPKRSDSEYPFKYLAGVGVAFKLVQALQTKIDGLPFGQEKWLLDLVALGTVCDVMPLIDENRIFVHFGLKTLAKTRRPGLRALMAVAGIDMEEPIKTRSLGFGLGPRMNAAGRLETAQYALDMLMADENMMALEKAQILDDMNVQRRDEQRKILKEAVVQAEKYSDEPVLVVSGPDWNHGIVGIVAARLLEKYKKPAFVFQEMGETSKGSARSYGDFSAVEALNVCEGLIISGGGHKLAAGLTLSTENIGIFRDKINNFYKSLNLTDQPSLLLPMADTEAELDELTEDLIGLINQLEPFGEANPQPILKTDGLTVRNVRIMGSDAQHVKLELADISGRTMNFLAFNAPKEFFVETGKTIDVWYNLGLNEWQGRKTVEGMILHLEQK